MLPKIEKQLFRTLMQTFLITFFSLTNYSNYFILKTCLCVKCSGW